MNDSQNGLNLSARWRGWLCSRRFFEVEKNSGPKKSLTLEEQTRAKILIYKQIQGEVYRDEISQLKVGKKIAKNSQIANLDPFLDKEAI